jgi:CRISPR-associated protein Csd1
MILRVLYDYAVEEGLAESMDVKERLVHLVLTLRRDGSVSDAAPWQVLSRPLTDPRTNSTKTEVGKPLPMPEFPGVNAGGKAYFLADACEKVLGLNGKTGAPVPDDPAQGGNATKAFQHFWDRVADAHAATGLPELAALLAFRDRYLASEEARRTFPFVRFAPLGKDDKPTFCALTGGGPVPLDKKTITFEVGALDGPVFQPGTPLHDYWKAAFARERFTEPTEGAAAHLGVCLVTGAEGQPIAEVHRTLIKGVPGLPPIGGYLVSFDKSTPSLTSYGFDRGWNAPVSESAAAAYALALNHILADGQCSRRFGDAMLASWVEYEPDLTRDFNAMLNVPSPGDVAAFFHEFEAGGRYHPALDARHFRSLTLAANGGRVVVRRWLDEPLRDAVDALRDWFTHLETDVIEVPRKAVGRPKRAARPRRVTAEAAATEALVAEPSQGPSVPPPLSVYALAAATARVPSEVPSAVHDALYRAALERANPRALLGPLLHRLRIAAVQSGSGVRFQTPRFALLKLILIRSEETPMEITPSLCETHDPAYNCGRLLAVLDDLQRAAQGRVGADVVARFYGNASTFPRNVFQRLMRLEKHHRAKLLKNPKARPAGLALGGKVDAICALFPASGPGGPPEFPGLLTPREQGRFALGFHQQKAKDERDRRKAAEAKKAAGAAAHLDAEAAEADAIAQALDAAETAEDSD